MKVLLTGAAGFLGQHLRARLKALTTHDVVPVDHRSWPRLQQVAQGVGAVVHLAGVNRGSSADVDEGNVEIAEDLASALRMSGGRPTIVFANSIQAGNGTPYGTGKARAAAVLAAAAQDIGSVFVDVRLPNLFGEHGRPHYNSFVATFVEAVVQGYLPEVSDRPVELLHVQAASQAILEALERSTDSVMRPEGTWTTVLAVLHKLQQFNELYALGDLPPLTDHINIDLFNTLRAARFPDQYPIQLHPRCDERGRLTEIIRSHGGAGQTFVSTTRPGITRGEHYHLRKVERFVVVAGQARISLRRLFSEEVVNFDVEGERPVIVDMPTLWAHNLTNTGSTELTTLFWTNELFDPTAPDTFAERVSA